MKIGFKVRHGNYFYYLAKGFAKGTKNGSKRWPLKPGQRPLLPCDLSELMDRLVAINVLEVVMSESLTQLNKQAIAAARQHMGHVAWPTVALTAFVVVLFVANLVLFAQGLIPAWLALSIMAVLTYLSYTPLHEAAHRNINGSNEGLAWLNNLCGYLVTMYWRADKPATLVYVEALDEGDPAKKVEFRDAVYTWDAPFDSNPKLLAKTELRYRGIEWGNDEYAVIYDYWFDTRKIRTFIFNPNETDAELRLFNDRNSQDVYSDPGSFERRRNEFGRYVLAIDNETAYLIGDGHSPEGQFPFVDQLNLKTLKTTRWYQSIYDDKVESIHSIIDAKKGIALVRIESPTEYPNYFVRNLNKKESIRQITYFENPFESLKGVHKEVIRYNRKDGVELSGTLYLPENYDPKKDGKLPLLIWAYPSEYKDKSSAGQSTHNSNEFTFPYYGSFVYWVTRGYAVLDDAAFPIVGEGEEEPNDTFVEQLIWNAEAAIDAVDKLGFIDPKRVGVGGHSYGAFMTANLLTHSDLFACGIARSGAYNRTLTPFGFQREQRNFWEASDVYNQMSPFMHAEKMKTPMLLTHGEYDNNPGTFTLQTERYFQALKGLGAPVRMVILPKESHGYVAKENIMHLLWEQDQFLEKHLKNKQED